MSPDEFALLQAIRANPADDLPRLVYADYLEERGDELSVARAEFIRVQCTLASLPSEDPDRERLTQRETNLLSEHGTSWARQVRNSIRHRVPKLPANETHVQIQNYHRGMIASATIPSRLFREYPEIQAIMGPIQYLAAAAGHGRACRELEDDDRPWDLQSLKVLSLPEIPDGVDFPATEPLGPMGREVLNVPILDLTQSRYDRPPIDEMGRRILRGIMNPVVIVPARGLTNRPFVFDPLDLWPLVHTWAETYVAQVRRLGVHYDTWNRTEADIRAIPSARLPHLVRYYRLAGLPQPAGLKATLYPNEERMLPKRSILSRAARWLRRGR